MKIFDRYIARQLLGVTVLGVMSLSALLLLGNLFKELRPLLVESGAPFTIVMEFIFQVIPFSLMFSIPWGFLTAVLLVYGRHGMCPERGCLIPVDRSAVQVP